MLYGSENRFFVNEFLLNLAVILLKTGDVFGSTYSSQPAVGEKWVCLK